MTLSPHDLEHDLDVLEAIEKATLRMVVEALYSYADEARRIFAEETDEPGDIAEDVTREALDALGFSVMPIRLFGKIDFKRARYVFHPEYSVKQALFVDSKAEAPEGSGTATIQTSQTSLRIRQRRSGRVLDVQGGLPPVYTRGGDSLLTTTIFVKYHYAHVAGVSNELHNVVLACLPNGFLQTRYNPTPDDGFWRAGRDAPTRGEAFRVRIHFGNLKGKARWRVQKIQFSPSVAFDWDG